MTSYGGYTGDHRILFANARIRQVSADTSAGTLYIKALYDEREYFHIQYSDVYYSQLDENADNLEVVLAEELTLSQFRQWGSKNSKTLLIAECGGGSEEFLSDLARRGYSLFIHYLDRARELLVIAKEFLITQ